jgi:cell division protein FtsW (lipid II flippase)
MSTATATFVEIRNARRWRAFDWQLLLYLLLLVGFGMVMGFSANYQAIGGDSGLSQTVKTLIWTGIGLTLFFVAASIDYHWLQTFATPIYLVVLGLLFATVLVGRNLFGAQMSITLAGVDFQFSEISKVLMIVVLAAFLASRRERIGRLSTNVGAGLLMALPAFHL